MIRIAIKELNNHIFLTNKIRGTYQSSPMLADTLQSVQGLSLPVVHLEHLADGALREGYLIYFEFLKALEALLLIL